MRALIFLAIIAFAVAKLYVDPAAPDKVRAAQQKAVAESEAGKPIPITDSIWTSAFREGTWLVEFYAPWCGHCKKLGPIWEQLAASAAVHRAGADESKHYHVAAVDCVANEQICHSFGVQGYPTIKLVRNGHEVYDFGGIRKLEVFEKFVQGEYAKERNEGFPYENEFLNELRIFKNEALDLFPGIYAGMQKWARERILPLTSGIFLVFFTLAFIIGRLTGPEDHNVVRARKLEKFKEVERAVIRIQSAYRGFAVRNDPTNSPQKAKGSANTSDVSSDSSPAPGNGKGKGKGKKAKATS